MKNIIVKINKLGAIKDSIIEIRPLIVISGESNLGKSYLATLIHYLYRQLLEWKFRDFFTMKGWEYETISAIDPNQGTIVFSAQELTDWLNNDSQEYMREAIGNPSLEVDISFSIPFNQSEYRMSYKTEYFGLAGKEELFVTFELENLSIPYRISASAKGINVTPWSVLLGQSIKTDLFGDDALEQTFTMPPGRGSLLNVGALTQEALKGESSTIREFLEDWTIVRDMPIMKERDLNLSLFLNNVMEGRIILDENKRTIYQMNDGTPLPINAAASSIKELAPLSMLVSKYPIKGISILFEEPEAHLHPSKQVNISDFITLAINQGAHIQVTTHSDYVIRRINDRIVLFKLKDLLGKEKYQKILEETNYRDITLDPKLLGAYLLRRRNNNSVEVLSQTSEDGISYESFHKVLVNDVQNSYSIQQKLEDAR